MQAPGSNVPLIQFLILVPHCLLLYIACFPTYPFFFTYFFIYLLPYLYFPLRSDPLRFQAGCRKRKLNLALVFFVYFMLQNILVGECMLLLCWVFSTPSQEIVLGKHVRSDLFCVEWDVNPQLNESAEIVFHCRFIRTCLFTCGCLQCLDAVGWASGRASGL